MIRTVICTNHWVLSLHEIFILWVSDKSLIIIWSHVISTSIYFSPIHILGKYSTHQILYFTVEPDLNLFMTQKNENNYDLLF